MTTLPKMFYFGPWDEPGHYLHDEHGRSVRQGPEYRGSFPWSEWSGEEGIGIDCQLQPGCYKDRGHWRHGNEKEGEAIVHHKNGWTALSFWDRSVDTRGACNSNYFAEGNFTFDEMVAMAKERFAQRWEKMGFRVIEAGAQVTRVLPK